MIAGQGSPAVVPRRFAHGNETRSWFGWLMLVVVALCAAPGEFQSESRGESLGVRIAWGGGKSRQWRVAIRVTNGSLSKPVPLGLDPDTPGSIVAGTREVRVLERSPRVYNGIDLHIDAALDAKLLVSLTPVDGGLEYQEEVLINQLLTRSIHAELDDHNNRLLIRRQPGDQLRLDFRRDSLVFTPGEEFELSVQPQLTGLAAKSHAICDLQLFKARTDDDVWSDDREVAVGPTGICSTAGPFSFQVPAIEGVYDLVVSLRPKTLTGPIVRAKPVAQRRLQLVVVDSLAVGGRAAAWEEELEINPAHPGWLDRIRSVPQLKRLPGLGEGPLTHGGSRKRPLPGGEFIEVDPGGWQAYPLPIDAVGRPHILEVEYPKNIKQTLGISIVEPNALGIVTPLGLDSGVDVPHTTEEDGVALHRLIFWPRTETPVVLLTNRRDDAPCLFGKLRVLVGPASLPPATVAREFVDERLLAAFFDKPLFPENFGATEALDAESHRSLDDWVTFYAGGRRLVEYLKHVGYNAAVISVMTEGSAIYPSRLLQPTPKYDSGVYFSTAQDPRRKDVLELLFRLFDREGLKLIPSLQFATPLPELEELRHRGQDAAGLELINGQGHSWLATHPSRGGLAPYYNPLDPRVQAAMGDVVEELAERYADHRSFGGVAIQMGPDTYTHLPGEGWGYDDRTVDRFQRETGVEVEAEEGTRFEQRAEFLSTDGREVWLAWRARQIAKLHHELQQRIDAYRRGSKLYLTGADIVASQQVRESVRPRLSGQGDVAVALLQMGLDPTLYQEQANTILLQPQRRAPLLSLVTQQTNLQMQREPDVRQYWTQHVPAGAHFYHEPQTLRLPSFDAKSPFGADRTTTWLVAQISPSGHENRRRFINAVASFDAPRILDGGWMLPLGQEDSLREIVEVYRRLPAARFKTAGPRSLDANGHPVIVRTFTRGRNTYVYLVNNSPWPVTVELDMQAPVSCDLESLGSRRLPVLGHDNRWSLQLQPYDLVGARFHAANVDVKDWRVTLPDEVAASLRRQIRQMSDRVRALEHLPPVNVLSNPGFEVPVPGGKLPGWFFPNRETIRVEPDFTQHRSGRASLKITSTREVAWLRSAPFATPKTGRVAVVAYLKTPNLHQQPPLRLAIEYRQHGQVKYKFAKVGAGKEDGIPRLKTTWEKFVFHVDDLPLAGVTEVHVGFDLMGPGTIWLDDVQVFDRWFDENERKRLLWRIAQAGNDLDTQKIAQCQQFLESYWPLYLTHFVPLPSRIADVPRDRRPPAPVTPPQNPGSPSVWDRVKDLPKKVLPF